VRWVTGGVAHVVQVLLNEEHREGVRVGHRVVRHRSQHGGSLPEVKQMIACTAFIVSKAACTQWAIRMMQLPDSILLEMAFRLAVLAGKYRSDVGVVN